MRHRAWNAPRSGLRPESDLNSIAVAITSLVYGVDSYVSYYPVLEALMQSIISGATGPNDPSIIANLRNGDLINYAIARASSIGPVGELFVSDGGLRTMIYDDLGMVDFARAAFSIFGFEIQSLYYLYFTLLSLSALVFIVQFRAKPSAQALLLCVLSAFFLEVQTRCSTTMRRRFGDTDTVQRWPCCQCGIWHC